jgi:non-ribosomal peptide synthase protein (TIGR01720 family)
MLRRWARTDNLVREAEYWQLVSSIPAPDLPQLPHPPSTDLYQDEQVEIVALNQAETEIFLRGEHGAYRTAFTAQDVLLAAATIAIGEWTGDAQVYFELEGHGRTANSFDVDAGRTVGWFTSRFPAWFDLVDVPIVGAAVAVAEQRRAIPNHGLGYGLLRYFGPDDIRSALSNGVAPQISLNYLGQSTVPANDAFSVTSWAPNSEDRGMERDPSLARSHPIAIEAMVIDRSLAVFWQFNPRLHARSDIARVAASFIRHVATMCAASQNAAPYDRASETDSTKE